MPQRKEIPCFFSTTSARLNLTGVEWGLLHWRDRRAGISLSFGILLTLTLPSAAGVLTPAQPIVESNRYVIPVHLSEAQGAVTALDFRLDFDAAVFRPVSVEAGASTLAAGKLVNSNSPGPGAYRVVVMGLNQDAIPAGEVARLVLERIEPGDGGASFAVSDPTLALADGSKEPASGGNVSVRPASSPEEAVETPEEATPETPETEPAAEAGENPPAPEDSLSEDVTEQVMDGMLGALTAPEAMAKASSDGVTPGATRVSGEDGGQKLSIRNRRWALPEQLADDVTVIGKDGAQQRAEETLDSSGNPAMARASAGEPGNGIIAKESGGEAGGDTLPPEDLHATATVESVGEAVSELAPSGVVREPSAERGWARTAPVLGALAAAAGALVLVWLRFGRTARQPTVSPKRG